MSKIRLLSVDEKKSWSALLDSLPESLQDVYYTPEYYEIYEKKGEGKACCFVYDDGTNLALYPFILSRINDLGYSLHKPYYDIQGAYGYNGVLSTTYEKYFIGSFYQAFKNYCNDSNIIAEFTRFHPLIGNENFSKEYLDVVYNRRTVYIDLMKEYTEIYSGYTRSTKGNLKKAKNNNLIVKCYKNEFPYLNDFIEMYNETMDRVKAAAYLYFNREYFINTFENLPLTQFVVFMEDIPIASALCLCKGVFSHIHFEASRKEYLSYRPNNILFDSIIRKLSQEKYQKLHIGGGNTPADDDSLLRYKKNFSKNEVKFCIGKKIYNKEVYDNLCDQWRRKYPEAAEKYKDILLKYKFQNNSNKC